MRVSTEDGMTWYEHAGRKACVVRKHGGYTVHSFWDRDGKHWVGGYGEATPVPLATAHQMAERFVSGQSVPDELGGFDDNKPEAVND